LVDSVDLTWEELRVDKVGSEGRRRKEAKSGKVFPE